MRRPASFTLIDRRMATILAIVLVQMIGASMILPILPLYAKDEFGLGPQAIALLAASFFIAQFVAGPPLGRLSDKLGRVPVLLVSQAGTVLSFFALGLAPAAWVLFVARIVDGLTGGNIIVAQAYVVDVTPRERRAEALGLVLAAFGVSFFIGPAIGGALASAFGPRTPYVIASAVALLTLALTWFQLEESVDAGHAASAVTARLSPSTVIRNKPLVLASILVFIQQYGIGMVFATFALLGADVIFSAWDPDSVALGVGLLLTVVGLGQIVTQLGILRPALRIVGEGRLVLVAVIVRGLAFALFAVATSPLVAALASPLFAVGGGLFLPPVQSLATKVVDDSLRGGVLGVTQSAGGLGVIAGTSLGGVLYAIAPQVPYWVGVGTSVIAIVPALVLRSLVRHVEEPPARAG